MTYTFCRISSLLHRTKCHLRKQSLVRFILYGFQKLLIFLWMYLISTNLEILLKAPHRFSKNVNLLRKRSLMYSIFKWDICPEVLLGDSLICHKHKIFYYLGSAVSIIRMDIYRYAFFIYDNLSLCHVKIDGTSLFSSGPYNLRKLEHQTEHRYQVVISLHKSFVASRRIFFYHLWRRRLTRKYRCDICIVHALINIYETLYYLMIHNLTGLINIHHA